MPKPNSLTQYTDLYRNHPAEICAHAPEALNALRQSALDILSQSRLPEKGDEGYEHTSLNDMFAPDYGVNINRVKMQADLSAALRCDVPNISTLLAVNINDMPSVTAHRLPEGVIFATISQIAETNPDFLKKYYGSVAPLANPEVALNTLLAQNGLVIWIKEGVTVEKPLQLVNLLGADHPLMAVRRLLIVMERNSRANLLVCDHTGRDNVELLNSCVTEIIVKEGSTLSVCDMEEATPLTSRCGGMFVSQKDDSKFTAVAVTLSCGNTRNDFKISLDGHHTETRLYGMAIASSRQHIDNQTYISHTRERGMSDQLFKYVLTDDATGAFEGLIYVAPGAVKTEAYQSNRNLLGSFGAKMHSKPQLEIYCDDVKCSHGATTGQLDPEALFYMRSRGIPEDEARTMLMQAFMSDVISSVEIESLRQRLTHLVERRFAGGKDCGDSCSASCHPSAPQSI